MQKHTQNVLEIITYLMLMFRIMSLLDREANQYVMWFVFKGMQPSKTTFLLCTFKTTPWEFFFFYLSLYFRHIPKNKYPIMEQVHKSQNKEINTIS